MKYTINIETNEIVKGDNLGANFRKPPYRPATQKEIDIYGLKELKESKISTCKSYLTKTDFRLIKAMDDPELYKEDYETNYKTLREEARAAINNLKDLTTLEEVQNYDISKFTN